jgi:hypothetical protein
MKKICFLISLSGLITVTAVQAQMQVTLTQNPPNFPYSYGRGGEFNALANASLLAVNPTLSGYSAATADATSFETFCVETMEDFNPGGTYNVDISQGIKFNNGQFSSPDGGALTLGAAWLYSQFAAGTLGGYDYSNDGGRQQSAGNLQNALWYLEGEISTPTDTLINSGADGTAFYNEALTAVGANINNASDGAYGVVVLNMYAPNQDGTDGAPAQDQLMVVPDYTIAVPEPTSLALASLGGLGVLLLRRKR